jgi:Flp pilus assembly protein TadG
MHRLVATVRRLHISRSRARDQRGYIATVVALLVPTVFLGCCALSVDTARWYVEAERVQRAADAAALAGVVWMPGDFATAKTTALAEAKKNGYDDASPTVVVTVSEGEMPSQLSVKVSSTITNNFGKAIGVSSTTVGRSALADYAGGLSMGSPCNEFGSDPYGTTTYKSTNCSDAGDFWANVGSPKADKPKGDAFQNNVCASGVDGCTTSTGPNTDYDPNGYIYQVEVRQATSNLQLEAFDPALIAVGDHCENNNLAGAKTITAGPTGNAVVTDPATRYAPNDGTFCTGDNDFDGSTGFTNQVATSFTVRQMGTADDPTRPWTWPALSSTACPGAKTYPGYDGDLSKALNKSNAGYQASVAATFRQWVTLCSLSSVSADTKLAIQVKTNGNGYDNANGHNRFSLRGYSSSSSAGKDNLSIAAFNKMAVYANVQSGSSRFFLTRVPSSAAGQTLNVSLFDIGDISGTGTLTFIAPTESGVTFSNCQTVGKLNGPDADCKFNVDSTFGGKWQAVYIPIPSTYTCTDSSPTGCWVKLKYDLSGTTQAQDTTSWESSIDGDPVRLIQ